MAIRETFLKLSDKTIALVGGFNSTTHMTMTFLTEQGADVALIGQEQPEARRVVEHINDQREIYAHYGRAGVVSAQLKSAGEASEIVAKILHSFGRLDGLIDITPCGQNNLSLSQALVKESLKFLTSRPRSRIIFVSHHPCLQSDRSQNEELGRLRLELVKEHRSKNLTVNEVILGLTEEYLLRKFPQAASIKLAFEGLKKDWPQARLLDPGEIASWLLFLSSPLSQGVNGQALHVDHGLDCVGGM